MDGSAKAQLIWTGIRTHELPDFHSSIEWAQARLIEFRQMNQAAEKSHRMDRRQSDEPGCGM
jgi:hypothetical protein